MNVTTQKLNRIIGAANFRRSHFSRSSRVKGWGSLHEGFEVEREFSSKFIEHKPWAASKSRRWKEVKTTVGFTIYWHVGDWFRGTTEEQKKIVAEKITAIEAVLKNAGVSAQRVEHKLVISISEVN